MGKKMHLLDSDKTPVSDGDSISFTYGIPLVKVIATIREENGKLIGTCIGNHLPKEFNLRSLRSYVGEWYKES